MTIAFLNPQAPLPKGVARLSQNEMAKFVAPDRSANVNEREFRPSRPVMHLCVALAWVNVLAALEGMKVGPVDATIRDKATLRRFLDLARELEEPILACKGLGVTYLNRIRWVGR